MADGEFEPLKGDRVNFVIRQRSSEEVKEGDQTRPEAIEVKGGTRPRRGNEEAVSGHIKSYSKEQAYGFASINGKVIFFHKSEITEAELLSQIEAGGKSAIIAQIVHVGGKTAAVHVRKYKEGVVSGKGRPKENEELDLIDKLGVEIKRLEGMILPLHSRIKSPEEAVRVNKAEVYKHVEKEIAEVRGAVVKFTKTIIESKEEMLEIKAHQSKSFALMEKLLLAKLGTPG